MTGNSNLVQVHNGGMGLGANKAFAILVACVLIALGSAHAQAPVGAIAGVVRDPSGAAIPGAQLKLTSRATSFTRTIATLEQGDFSFPALLAGEYEVSVEVAGFQHMLREAVVEAGATTTVDFALLVGSVKDSV